jgi:polyhydroxyalkanoate synthesis regulator phasin
MTDTKREQLLQELRKLKEMLKDREAALPAHSVRPHQIQEIEELEEKIADMEKELEGR